MIIVNLKTYKESTGLAAVKLAKSAEKVTREYGVRIVLVPQATDLRLVKDKGHIEVFAQHIDEAAQGKFTGWTTVEAVKDAGATGVLINHSEHRIPFEKIKYAVERCRALGLQSIVCADSVEEGEKLKSLKPDFIAVEPPELIGGDISVSKAKPEIISDAVARVQTKETSVLVGAGIKDGNDVRVALDLKSKGILVASGVVLAKDPEAVLRDFAKAWR